MPRTAEQNQELREESKARIVAAALRVFAREGYERASVRLIAQEAGVAQGLLYNYFAGKEQLLEAIFLEGLRGVEESFAISDTGGTPAQRLEQLLRGSFAILRRDRAFWTLFYSLRWQPIVAKNLAAQLVEWNDRILTTLGAILTDLGVADTQTEATILFALIDGLGQQFVMHPDELPVDTIVRAVLARWSLG